MQLSASWKRAVPSTLRRCCASLCHFVVLVSLFGSPTGLRAHDPPEEYYGRQILITLEPGFVRVHYHLELSQVSLYRLPKDDAEIRLGAAIGRSSFETACMDRFKILVPDQLVAFFNDKPVTWIVETTKIDRVDSTHFHLELMARWKPSTGNNSLEISDGNFEKGPGPYKMRIRWGPDINPTEIDEPHEWTSKGAPPEKCRKASAVFQVAAEAVEHPPPFVEETSTGQPSLSIWQRLDNGDLAGLLESSYGFWLLILVALVHGAGHSLMPGHGKTMVAAYLVGERGTPSHAVLLGIVTTLTHTSAAIAIAVLLQFCLPSNSTAGVQRVLQFSCGLMMAGIGIWLFLQRLAGRSDHVHLFDAGHGHSHGGEGPRSIGKAGFVRLVLLGIAGGIIPCWGAVMWVIGCIATSQFWLALPIVLAFSIGLATVLIVIGLSVVYSGRIGQRQWGRRTWFKVVFNERTVRWLPVLGAGLVVVIGLFLCGTSGIASK
jgi:nickel/cobalt transporter (NicO) family protein